MSDREIQKKVFHHPSLDVILWRHVNRPLPAFTENHENQFSLYSTVKRNVRNVAPISLFTGIIVPVILHNIAK